MDEFLRAEGARDQKRQVIKKGVARSRLARRYRNQKSAYYQAAMGAKRTPLCPATFQRATFDHVLNKGPRGELCILQENLSSKIH